MKKYHVAIVFASILAYIYFSYNDMLSSGELEASGNFTYGVLAIYCIAAFLYVIKPNVVSNSNRTAWIKYLVYILLCIPLGRVRMEASLLHILFPVISFLLYYRLCNTSDAIKTCTLGFLGLFLFLSYYFVNVLILNGSLVMGTIGGQSNLIYWPFMLIPFILLLDDRWYKIALFSLITVLSLLSLKRGAMIAVAVIWIYYIFTAYSNDKTKRNRIILGIFLSFFVIYTYMQAYADAALDRFDSMKTDEGSGRYDIWDSVFKALGNNSVLGWIFGNGEGSIKITGHTSGHNDFLHILFQYGIIGASFYVSIVIKVIKRFLTLRTSAPILKVSYFASVAIVIIVGMISDLWISYSYFAFLTAYWGCIEGTIERNKLLINNKI